MSTTSDSAATHTFMAVGIIRDEANLAEFAALRDDEHKQLEALRSEGKIGAHYVSQPRKATFIEVIAADGKQETGRVSATFEPLRAHWGHTSARTARKR